MGKQTSVYLAAKVAAQEAERRSRKRRKGGRERATVRVVCEGAWAAAPGWTLGPEGWAFAEGGRIAETVAAPPRPSPSPRRGGGSRRG